MSFEQLTKDCVFRYRYFNDNTLSEIVDSKIWHGSLDSLNDPYELPLIFDWSCFDAEDLPNALARINRKLLLFDPMDKLTSFLVENQAVDAADEMKTILRGVVNRLKEYYSHSLVTCFSKEPFDGLMWSHYSDGMKGLCIAYDVDKLKESDEFSTFYDVMYDDKPVPFTYSDFELINPDSKKERLTYSHLAESEVTVISKQIVLRNIDHIFQKHTRWKYEQEVRNVIIAPTEKVAGRSVSIKKDAIKAIMYGSHIRSTNLYILKLICKERNIQLFEVSPDKTNFGVTVKPAI